VAFGEESSSKELGLKHPGHTDGRLEVQRAADVMRRVQVARAERRAVR
jgi:hypothetical protein